MDSTPAAKRRQSLLGLIFTEARAVAKPDWRTYSYFKRRVGAVVADPVEYDEAIAKLVEILRL